MADTKDVLKQRGAIYGDYKRGCVLRRSILQNICEVYYEEHGEDMPDMYQEYLWDIVNKIIRLAVTPTHVDSWQDIAGYATLVKNQLTKEYPNAN